MAGVDLIIVGAGIAGKSVGQMAAKQGLSFLIIDAPPTTKDMIRGSDAAVGVLRMAWMGSAVQKQRLKASLRHYAQIGALHQGALVSNFAQPQTLFDPLYDGDYYGVDVTTALHGGVIAAVLQAKIVSVDVDKVEVRSTDGFTWQARYAVVLCCGPGGPGLIGPAHDHFTIGTTYIRGAQEYGQPNNDSPLRVHRTTPYNCLTISHGRETRVGSSSVDMVKGYMDHQHLAIKEANTRLVKACLKTGGPFQREAAHVLPTPPVASLKFNKKGTKAEMDLNGYYVTQTKEAHLVTGMRAHPPFDITKQYEPYYFTGLQGDRVVRFDGLAKFGYALAPAVAQEIVTKVHAMGPVD